METPKKKHFILADAAEDWAEDSFHSHAEIAEIIDATPGSNEYFSAITQARKILLRKRILWVTIHNAGYRVATPDEFTAAVRGNIYGAAKRMRKAVDVDDAAPIERMSAGGRQAHQNLSDRLKVHAAMMQGACREVRQLADPKIKMTR